MHETYFLVLSGPEPQKCNICFPGTAADDVSPQEDSNTGFRALCFRLYPDTWVWSDTGAPAL